MEPNEKEIERVEFNAYLREILYIITTQVHQKGIKAPLKEEGEYYDELYNLMNKVIDYIEPF